MIYILQRHVVGQNSFERKQISVICHLSPTPSPPPHQSDLCFRQQYLLTRPRWFKKRPWRRCPSHQCWESSPTSFLLHPRIQATDLWSHQFKGQFCACKSYYENFTLLCRGVVNGLVWVEFSGLLTEECEIERWMEGRRSVATHYYSTTDLILRPLTIYWTKIWVKVSGAIKEKSSPKTWTKDQFWFKTSKSMHRPCLFLFIFCC